ncbi:MAG: hypothetical protein ACTS9Y_01165 [Methylophilus sp.]|uniref:hypothetical protein n=1 Tax=Methylophilus sp. TaxID=29541 RepID=UPI003FA17A6A
MQSSIISHKSRGPWGQSSWRGNASGHVYVDLFNQYKPQSFVDPCCGSNTALDVAKEMKIPFAVGLDLHSGFNGLKDSILERVGRQVEMCFSHLPYHDVVKYSGNVWGNEAHPDDLSQCSSPEDFNEKAMVFMLNQREATLPGFWYGTLLGDQRKAGRYYAYTSELISRMPSNELASVIIKAQHNCVSDSRQYANMKHPRIMHEYIVLWQKPRSITSYLGDLAFMAREASNRLTSIWRAVVKSALISLGGKSNLADLYNRVEKDSPENLKTNKNWQAKIRQVLQSYSDFSNVDRGIWQLA